MIEFTEESPWDNWISLPHLVIYEDGSAVVYQRDQAQSAIPPSQVPTTSSRSTSTSDGARSQYGGLLPWAVGHVSRCELGQILTDLAGVDPEHTGFGQPQVFDASGTSVRVYGVGEATADDYDAYALAADFDEGLSAAERQARARLRAVMARTEAAVHTVGVLPVDRVEVTSLLSTTSGPYGSEATPTWPLATSPQTVRGGKRCGEVRGADAAKVAAAVPVDDRRRDPLFVGAWQVSGGDSEYLLVRVVPPGVEACR